MSTIRIIEGTEIVQEYESVTNRAIIIAVNKEGFDTHLTSKYYKLDEKFALDQSFVNIITELKKCYPDYLQHIVPERVMFIIDEAFEKGTTTTINSAWYIKLKYVSSLGKFMQRLFGYDYVITMRTFWLKQWSKPQLAAAVLSQLLRIEQDSGTIVDYNEAYLSKVTTTFGKNYLEPGVTIEDVLDHHVELSEFKSAPISDKQVSFEDFGDKEEDSDERLPFDDVEDDQAESENETDQDKPADISSILAKKRMEADLKAVSDDEIRITEAKAAEAETKRVKAAERRAKKAAKKKEEEMKVGDEE